MPLKPWFKVGDSRLRRERLERCPPHPSRRQRRVGPEVRYCGLRRDGVRLNYRSRRERRDAASEDAPALILVGLSIAVTIDVVPPGGVSASAVEETKSALRELGAEDNLRLKD